MTRPEPLTANRASTDSGSFRDRDGRIYRHDGRILRGISAGALKEFTRLRSTKFYADFQRRGEIVETEFLDAETNPLPPEITRQWAGFVEHRRIPVISYPYEWTFGMLRDAARLQLDLLEAAIGEGMTLKDATPYNIQFERGRPVFIDIPSFETLPPGAPWSGYRQFCEMFLFPLMLQAYKGIHFQPLMRANIDGVGVQTAARLFGLRDRFRSGVLSHVWLQAKLDSRYGGTKQNVRSDLKSAGFNKELILANVRKLRKLVNRLSWQGEGSEWGAYEEFHNYSESDHRLKESFIDECVAQSGAKRVWDIGCNTGQFSKIAARHAETVLAMDLDPFAVERLYREIRERSAGARDAAKDESLNRILPLVQNIADPSPNWGWRNAERVDLRTRARPDLALCLALIHHVVISANVPMAEFAGWLGGLADQVIIEYVSRRDDKVKALLRNKEDRYSDYSRENLEAELKAHYEISRVLELESGNRCLYWVRRPAS
jgi:SAM-dependent methyltransferase